MTLKSILTRFKTDDHLMFSVLHRLYKKYSTTLSALANVLLNFITCDKQCVLNTVNDVVKKI